MKLSQMIEEVLSGSTQHNEAISNVGKPPKDTYSKMISTADEFKVKVGDQWVKGDGSAVPNSVYLGDASFALKRSGGFVDIVVNDSSGAG